jgi:hypothetical protein
VSRDRRIAGILKAHAFTRILNGHFDGEHIVLDHPQPLKPNIRLKIIVLKSGLTRSQIIAAARDSRDPFSKRFLTTFDPMKK